MPLLGAIRDMFRSLKQDYSHHERQQFAAFLPSEEIERANFFVEM